MKRAQIEGVHEGLVELIDGWNDAVADGDRGRGNNSVVLVIHDDGSGFVGEKLSASGEFVELGTFRDADELIRILDGWNAVED